MRVEFAHNPGVLLLTKHKGECLQWGHARGGDEERVEGSVEERK